jgi:[pyruvate, water dikinase]-phosphate phosphotransferase / [pyruvate, water dikinase] kinase
MSEKIFHLHLVSDATGETINAITRACIVQFENIVVEEHNWNLVHTPRQLDMVIEAIRHWPGIVLYTFVDEELRKKLEEACRAGNVAAVSALDPVLQAMAGHFGVPFAHIPGRQHIMDAGYFARIDAMDFALAQDDGRGAEELKNADVIILGVSRTSKTPTCLYLANRGIKAANIPIIPNQPLQLDLTAFKKPLLIGLTKDPETLIEIRRNRLHLLAENRTTAYIDPEQVREELLSARKIFGRFGCFVLDVTNRSIEETAAEIIMLLAKKKMAEDKSAEGKAEA